VTDAHFLQHAHIFAAVLAERAHQDCKYGTHQARDLTISDYWTIMQQELNEAGAAIGYLDADEALCEILQVVATGWACLQHHGVIERTQPESTQP
jgi:hypothetical protein